MADYTKKPPENSFGAEGSLVNPLTFRHIFTGKVTIQNVKTSHIVECLLEDMEKLRDGRWVPDGDSIDSHMDYIEELARRVK